MPPYPLQGPLASYTQGDTPLPEAPIEAQRLREPNGEPRLKVPPFTAF